MLLQDFDLHVETFHVWYVIYIFHDDYTEIYHIEDITLYVYFAAFNMQWRIENHSFQCPSHDGFGSIAKISKTVLSYNINEMLQ